MKVENCQQKTAKNCEHLSTRAFDRQGFRRPHHSASGTTLSVFPLIHNIVFSSRLRPTSAAQMITSTLVTLEDVHQAHVYIEQSGLVRRTPLLSNFTVPAPGNTKATIDLHLKMESLQHTGSFKIRGMTNCFRLHEETIRKHGAVTLSAGNAGRSFAYLCGRLGVVSTVCMPNTVPSDRVDTIQQLGSTVELVPGVELMKAVHRYTSQGRILIHPFDDHALIAGHGSIGLEILEDMQDLNENDVVAVCCGGGGLVSGVAAALKLSGCKAKVVAVEPIGSACMSASVRLGRAAKEPEDFQTDTIAHGLAPPFAGEITYNHVKHFVDEVITVSDQELIAATKEMYAHGFVVETSGCAGVAAVMSGKVTCTGRYVCVVSGSNISREDLYEELKENDEETSGKRERQKVTNETMFAITCLFGVFVGSILLGGYHVGYHQCALDNKI